VISPTSPSRRSATLEGNRIMQSLTGTDDTTALALAAARLGDTKTNAVQAAHAAHQARVQALRAENTDALLLVFEAARPALTDSQARALDCMARITRERANGGAR
jgi:hypothetical protein